MFALANDMGSSHGSNPSSYVRAWYPEVDRSKADAVVHLVDFDAEALVEIPEMLGAAGLPTRVCSNSEVFADPGLRDIPGCVVLHVQPGQISTLGFLADFQRRAGGAPIVVAADHANARTVVLAFKAGAAGFVEKPFRDRDMLEAVLAAIEMDRTRRQREARAAELWRRFRTLTPREREVMALVTAGRLNKQAAGDLGLSEITIKAHRGSAVRKMAARTVADLVRMADVLANMDGAETEIFRSRP
jgi:FixJ family two-component response regulator